MRVLEYYSGNTWGQDVFREFGINVTSVKAEEFDYSLYPRNGF